MVKIGFREGDVHPDLLKDAYVPGEWLPPDAKTRAIRGHEFGLKLAPAEREQLIALLRTLQALPRNTL